MVKGSAPFTLLRSKVGEDEFARQSAVARAYLRPILAGQTSLGSTAYLAVARRP